MIHVDDYFINGDGHVAVVVEYISVKEIIVEFNDNPDHRMVTTAKILRSEQFTNPFQGVYRGFGTLGKGRFKVKENGVQTPEYKAWFRMLKQCYNTAYACAGAYTNDSVNPDWLDFQVFAEWAVKQHGLDQGWVVNKLIIERREYSVKSCLLIPESLDLLITERVKNPLHRGVVMHRRKYKASFKPLKFHKSHDSILNAFMEYKYAKESYIKNLAATEYASALPENVKEILKTFTVKL